MPWRAVRVSERVLAIDIDCFVGPRTRVLTHAARRSLCAGCCVPVIVRRVSCARQLSRVGDAAKVMHDDAGGDADVERICAKLHVNLDAAISGLLNFDR